MSEEKKQKKSLFDSLPFLNKLKQVKHIGLIVTIIFILILLLILFGGFGNSKSFLTFSSSSNTSTTYQSNQYVDGLESKLKNLLGKIKGAKDVEVMIAYESGTTYVGQNSSDTSLVSAGKTSNTSETTFPKITGVVIVSSGASDISVRLDMQIATETLLGLSADKIQIFVGN